MTEEASAILENTAAATPEKPSIAVPENPAIARCRAEWKRAYQGTIANGERDYTARENAGWAYRRAMPPLTGRENISSFVACVAHGILIGAIDRRDANKLLYAAQVALATVRSQPHPPKDPAA
jgi:predicted chitinase